MNNFIQCLSAFVACIGFSLIFRIHHQLRFVLVSSFGGALGWLVFLLFNNFNNENIRYFMIPIPIQTSTGTVLNIDERPNPPAMLGRME